MEKCKDYYNANAVAQEIEDKLYTWVDMPTLCDCGAVAEKGDVYCMECKTNAQIALNLAIEYIAKNNLVNNDTALSQLIYVIEER